MGKRRKIPVGKRLRPRPAAIPKMQATQMRPLIAVTAKPDGTVEVAVAKPGP